jgi:hypothetical protein
MIYYYLNKNMLFLGGFMKNILKNCYSGRKCRVQITSLILIIVMMVIFIPTSVIALAAEKIADNENNISTESAVINDIESSEEDKSIEKTSIITEITSERKADQKNFLLDDGTMLAVQYDEPVHYINEDNGEWKTIDNTLLEIEKDGFSGYTNKSNEFNIELAKNLNQKN